MRLLSSTLRLRTIGEEYVQAAWEAPPTGRITFAIWHGHQFPLTYTWRNKGLALLSSLSRDGTLQSLTLGGLGYYIIRGSTSRGAVRGLVGIIRAVKEGHDAVFAVDGPHGPYHVVKPGVIYTAWKSESTIVPATCAVKRAHIFHKAWDRYILPFPFSRGVLAYGEGMRVPTDTSADELESLADELGERLERLTAEAEQALTAV